MTKSDRRKKIEELLKLNAGKRGIDKIVADEIGDIRPETIRKIRSSLGIAAGSRGRPSTESIQEESRLIDRPADELTRLDRIKRIQRRMQSDPKYKHYLDSVLNPKEREAFIQQFTDITIDMESLDSMEESHLFMGVLNFILALRYARRYRQQEEMWERYHSGKFDPDNSLSVARTRKEPPDENLMDEFNKKSALFNSFREKFHKVQEEKRRRFTSGKVSFLDYLEYYSHSDKQKEAAKDIMMIAKKTNEELRRMIEADELLGFFDD
jgi:DNA-directed RNA polymerase subunit F